MDSRARYQGPSQFVRTIFYGAVEEIIECTLPAAPQLRFTHPHKFLLAVITGCDTNGADATKVRASFDKFETTKQIVDLNAIGSVVGRVRCGTATPQWVIIDRSPDLARTAFTDDALVNLGGIHADSAR